MLVNVGRRPARPLRSCELCGSSHIQWFTPLLRSAEHGIFLCLACARINVRLSDRQADLVEAS